VSTYTNLQIKNDVGTLYVEAQDVTVEFGFDPQPVLNLTGLVYSYAGFKKLSLAMIMYIIEIRR
jgi:hypothetical protein